MSNLENTCITLKNAVATVATSRNVAHSLSSSSFAVGLFYGARPLLQVRKINSISLRHYIPLLSSLEFQISISFLHSLE